MFKIFISIFFLIYMVFMMMDVRKVYKMDEGKELYMFMDGEKEVIDV